MPANPVKRSEMGAAVNSSAISPVKVGVGNGHLDGRAVTILSYDTLTRHVFVQYAGKFYIMKASVAPSNSSLKGRVSYYNRSKAEFFEGAQIIVDKEDLYDGDIDGEKLYEQFLELSDDREKVIGDYKPTAVKTNTTARKQLSKIGNWHSDRVGWQGVVSQYAYSFGDVISVVASAHNLVSDVFWGNISGNLTVQAGFRLISMLSVVTGFLGFCNASSEYVKANFYSDIDEIRISLVRMARAVTEVCNGLLAVSYRVMLLAGNAVSGFVLQKVGLAFTYVGSIYVVLLALPYTFSAYRGSKTLEVIQKKGVRQVLDLNDTDKKTLCSGVYKKFGLYKGEDLVDITKDQAYDFVDQVLSYDPLKDPLNDEYNSILKKGSIDMYITGEDKGLVEGKVNADLDGLLKELDLDKHFDSGFRETLRVSLTEFYNREIVRIKRVKDKHLETDFESLGDDLRKLAFESKDIDLNKMRKDVNKNIKISIVCFSMVALTFVSMFLTSGVPLLVIICINLSFSIYVMNLDFEYLYKNIEFIKTNDKKEKSLDIKVISIVALTTVVATVIGIITTKNLAVQFIQGILGLWILSKQHEIYKGLPKNKDKQIGSNVDTRRFEYAF